MSQHIESGATIVIPTLNEGENIGPLIDKLFQIKPDSHHYQVIVVDDGSTDGTAEQVVKASKKHPVMLLQRGARLGLSSAVLDGTAKSDTPWILVMDADGSHPVEKVPTLLQPLFDGQADLTIGTRYISGGKISGWPLQRALLSRFGTILASFITPFFDPLSGFFACSKEFLLSSAQQAKGYKILLELLAQAPPSLRVTEVPIHFIDRVGGSSKMSMGIQLQFFSQLLRLFLGKMLTFSGRPQIRFLIYLAIMDLLFSYAMTNFGGLDIVLSQNLSFLLFALLFTASWVSADRSLFQWISRSGGLVILFCCITLGYGFRIVVLKFLDAFNFMDVRMSVSIAIIIGDLVIAKMLLFFAVIASGPRGQHRNEVRIICSSFLLIIITMVYKLLFLPLLDLIPQEALHWNRAMHFALAYVDHPGGVALPILIFTKLFGNSEFVVRLPAFICGVLTIFFIYATGKVLSGSLTTGMLCAATFSAAPFFFGNNLFVFPDSFLICAWSGAVYFLLRAVKTSRTRYWILAGLCIGYAFFSKYTTIFLIGGLGLFFLSTAKGRACLKEGKTYTILLSFGLMLLPWFIFEYHRGWVTIKYQFFRRMHSGYWAVPDFFGVIMGELSPLLAILICVVVFYGCKKWRELTPPMQLMLFLGLPMLIIYLVYSQWNRVKFSWLAPAFLSLIPFTIYWLEQHPGYVVRLKRWTVYSMLLFLCMFMLLLPITVGSSMSGNSMTKLRRYVLWNPLRTTLPVLVENIATKLDSEVFIIGADKYFTAAELSYYCPSLRERITSANALGRDGLVWREWSDLSSFKGKTALIIGQSHEKLAKISLESYFQHYSSIATLTLKDGVRARKLFYRIAWPYSPHLNLN